MSVKHRGSFVPVSFEPVDGRLLLAEKENRRLWFDEVGRCYVYEETDNGITRDRRSRYLLEALGGEYYPHWMNDAFELLGQELWLEFDAERESIERLTDRRQYGDAAERGREPSGSAQAEKATEGS